MADDEKRAGCVGKHEENVERPTLLRKLRLAGCRTSNIELRACHPERSEAESKAPVERPSACNVVPRHVTGALDFARDDGLALDVFFLIG